MYLAAHYYTTLEAVLTHLNNGVTLPDGNVLMSTASEAVDVDFIWRLIPAVSAMMTINAGVSFVPYYRNHLIRRQRLFDLRTILLPETPFELTLVRDGDSSQTDVTNDVNYFTDAINATPFLMRTEDDWHFDAPTYYVFVGGLFCFAPDPNQSRVTLGSVVLNDTTTTTLTLSSVDGLETGDLLMLAQELLLITAINTGTKAITFERGANGSAAAEHTATFLQKFRVNPMVKRLATEIVAWFVKNRHRVNELYAAPQGGQIKVGGLDPDIWKQLGMYAPISRDISAYR